MIMPILDASLGLGPKMTLSCWKSWLFPSVSFALPRCSMIRTLCVDEQINPWFVKLQAAKNHMKNGLTSEMHQYEYNKAMKSEDSVLPILSQSSARVRLLNILRGSHAQWQPLQSSKRCCHVQGNYTKPCSGEKPTRSLSLSFSRHLETHWHLGSMYSAFYSNIENKNSEAQQCRRCCVASVPWKRNGGKLTSVANIFDRGLGIWKLKWVKASNLRWGSATLIRVGCAIWGYLAGVETKFTGKWAVDDLRTGKRVSVQRYGLIGTIICLYIIMIYGKRRYGTQIKVSWIKTSQVAHDENKRKQIIISHITTLGRSTQPSTDWKNRHLPATQEIKSPRAPNMCRMVSTTSTCWCV